MSRYLDAVRNMGKVRVPDFIGSRAGDINLLALRSGVRARQSQVEGAVMHLGNVTTVVAQDPPSGARVRRGSDVIVFVDYRP
jgi:hypothetical protein